MNFFFHSEIVINGIGVIFFVNEQKAKIVQPEEILEEDI